MAGLGAAHALETARRAAAAVMGATDAGAAHVAGRAPRLRLGPVRARRLLRRQGAHGARRRLRHRGRPRLVHRREALAHGARPRASASTTACSTPTRTSARATSISRGRLHELPEGLILMVPTRLVPFAVSSLISWRGKLRMGLDLLLPRGPVGRRREPRRLRAPAAWERGARQGRRAHRGRHPRRRPRADERARDVPDVPRDGARAPQPDRRHDPQAPGASARGARGRQLRRRLAGSRPPPRPAAPALAARAPTFCRFGPAWPTWPTRWSPTCRPTACAAASRSML